MHKENYNITADQEIENYNKQITAIQKKIDYINQIKNIYPDLRILKNNLFASELAFNKVHRFELYNDYYGRWSGIKRGLLFAGYSILNFNNKKIKIYTFPKEIQLGIIDYNFTNYKTSYDEIFDYRTILKENHINEKIIKKVDKKMIGILKDANYKVKKCPDYIKKILVFI